MKRLFTATCLAASCAVGLAAQQTTGTAGTAGTGTTGTVTATDPQDGGQGRGGPRTITGCLRAGDTADSYMLTNVQGLGGGRRGGGATAAGGGTGTAAGAQGAGRGQGTQAMSIMLTADSSVDLKSHIGHHVEVVGTLAGGGGQRGGRGNRSMTVTSIRMIASTCTQ